MANGKRAGLTFLVLIIFAHTGSLASASEISVSVIVQKSAAANARDWQAQDSFSDTEREVKSKVDESGRATLQQSKTYENLTIEGSPIGAFWR